MYRLILPVGEILDGWTVYKPTGDRPYHLKREIRIYNDDPEKSKTIIADEGTVFLCGERGSINTIPESNLVALQFEKMSDIQQYIEIYINERDAK